MTQCSLQETLPAAVSSLAEISQACQVADLLKQLTVDHGYLIQDQSVSAPGTPAGTSPIPRCALPSPRLQHVHLTALPSCGW